MLVSASKDRTIKIWDLETYQEIRTFEDHEAICSVAVSDDNKHIISGDFGEIVRLWCFHTGKLISCFEGHTNSIRWVYISQQQPSLVSFFHHGHCKATTRNEEGQRCINFILKIAFSQCLVRFNNFNAALRNQT